MLDADSGKVVGKIADTPGVHGAAIAAEFHRGFTSNGRDKTVTIFDTKTLSTIGKVPLSSDTDFILYDPFSKRVFPINEKITVMDAQTGKVAGTVDLGADPEAAVSDGRSTVYINLADKQAVAVVDSKAPVVTKTYAIEKCTMCSGVDAGGFDPDKNWIFESCAEGVISVIRETTPDYYELIETVPTQLFARTMAFDPKTKNIYLLTAEFETISTKDPAKPFERKIKPGSFCVVVVGRN